MQELGATTSHICDAKVQNVFSSIRPQSWVKPESNATGDAACTRSALAFCYPKGLLQSSVNIRNRYRTVVSGRLNVVKDLKRTNQIVDFGRNRHMIGL
jgi:hypothetical protein